VRVFRGFTLVEILVVIAIVALLVAVILPTLAAARRQSRVIACAANLRTVGSAMHHYTRANRDWYPTHGTWAERCYPYVQKRGGGQQPTRPDWADRVWEEKVAFYMCPDDEVLHNTTWNRHVGGRNVRTRCWLSYGFNGFLSNRPVDKLRMRYNQDYSLTNRQRRTGQVARPGDIVMMADTHNDDICRVWEIDWCLQTGHRGYGGFLEVHHKAGNNFLYADNHVNFERMLGPPLPRGGADFLERMNGRGVPSFPHHWVPVENLSKPSESS